MKKKVNKFELESKIKDYLSSVLEMDQDSIKIDSPLVDLGLTSLQMINLIQFLNEEIDQQLSPTLAWECPTISALTSFVCKEESTIAETAQTIQKSNSEIDINNEPIAIVGMSCRFPGASDLESFWQLCWNGVDAITEIPPERWDINALYDPDPSVPGKIYSRSGGFLKGLDEFDASFFEISPREALHLDPRQRLMLECSWEAFEDAGIPPRDIAGSQTGVFISTISDDYGRFVYADLNKIEAHSGTGTAHSIVSNRLSYFYDFHGRSMSIDTACSGSLLSVHLACQSLRNHESNIALSGGVNVLLVPDSTIFFSRAGALSPDGHCKTFDHRANGFVRSEGAGIIVLKRLSDAIANHDKIYAVILGSAANHDGHTNGIMARARKRKRLY